MGLKIASPATGYHFHQSPIWKRLQLSYIILDWYRKDSLFHRGRSIMPKLHEYNKRHIIQLLNI